MEVSDNIHFLTVAQKHEIEDISSSFQMKVIFTSSHSPIELRSTVKSCVTSPSTICLGIDPIHRYTATEFGIDTGISKDNYPIVARAGNSDFSAGNWVNGVKDVAARANVMSQKSGTTSAVILQQSVIEKPMPIWPFFLGLGLMLIVMYWVWRRSRKNIDSAISEFRDEAQEMRNKNQQEAKWVAELERREAEKRQNINNVTARQYTPPKNRRNTPRPVPPPPVINQVRERVVVRDPVVVRQPVIINNPSPPVVIVEDNRSGFVEGMLIGSALADKPTYYPTPAPTPHIHRESVIYNAPEPTPTTIDNSFDNSSSGGDSSSFDSSSDSSSGGDSSSTDSSSGGGDDSSF